MSVADEELPILPIIEGVNFHGMFVNDSKLIGLDAKDYTSKGAGLIYNLYTNEKIIEVDLGISPYDAYSNNSLY